MLELLEEQEDGQAAALSTPSDGPKSCRSRYTKGTRAISVVLYKTENLRSIQTQRNYNRSQLVDFLVCCGHQ